MSIGLSRSIFVSRWHPTWSIRCKIVFQTTFLQRVLTRNALFCRKTQKTENEHFLGPIAALRNFSQSFEFSGKITHFWAKHSEEKYFGIRFCIEYLRSNDVWTKKWTACSFKKNILIEFSMLIDHILFYGWKCTNVSRWDQCALKFTFFHFWGRYAGLS